MGDDLMATAGMISRHFENDRGTTATLEFPAGWSSLKFYRLTVRGPDGVLAIPTETKTYDTPDEARAAAVRREREALASGWRPKMAAIYDSKLDRPTMKLYREDGRPLGCRVTESNGRERNEYSRLYEPSHHKSWMTLPKSIEWSIQGEAESSQQIPEVGHIIIARIDAHDGAATYFKLQVSETSVTPGSYNRTRGTLTVGITGQTIPTSDDLDRIVSNAVMRETLIANYDTVEHLPSYSILWSELSTAVPDHAARAVLVQEIINRRSERDAAQQRFRDSLARAEQTALRVERLPARRTTRTAPAAQEPPPQPTVDLGKPKQRKIKLGD
jgi:hypothetical protein